AVQVAGPTTRPAARLPAFPSHPHSLAEGTLPSEKSEFGTDDVEGSGRGVPLQARRPHPDGLRGGTRPSSPRGGLPLHGKNGHGYGGSHQRRRGAHHSVGLL